MLLMAYRQADQIAAAIAGALDQTYTPLEIVISDDASDDATWARILAAVAGYSGPHRVILNRNPVNLGIGAHLSHLVTLSHGELLFVAAGDDVSLPERCATVTAAWLSHARRPDLISSALTDIDASGTAHGRIEPSDLSRYRSLADWARERPFVVGAAQAWTRRVFERCGPLPEGVVAEDLIMTFRAIGCGGAITLPQALVAYRRGGLSARVRSLGASAVVARLLKNNRHALIEQAQLLADARTLGQLDAVRGVVEAELERERFVAQLFAAPGFTRKLAIAWRAGGVRIGVRLRLFAYAAIPWVYAPLFWAKRAALLRRAGRT
jgi:glycosyltransferase involved in cell wall biosynthesis